VARTLTDADVAAIAQAVAKRVIRRYQTGVPAELLQLFRPGTVTSMDLDSLTWQMSHGLQLLLKPGDGYLVLEFRWHGGEWLCDVLLTPPPA